MLRLQELVGAVAAQQELIERLTGWVVELEAKLGGPPKTPGTTVPERALKTQKTHAAYL